MTVRWFEVVDSTDPDYDELHDERCEVTEIMEDDVDSVTGDERDNALYRLSLDCEKLSTLDGETSGTPIKLLS
jgi:hypothetical protein